MIVQTDSLPDKWIKAKLNKAIEEVTRSLDEYRFNDAAAAIYRFIWHEFCDWYLEFSKPVLYGKVSARHKDRRLSELYTMYLKLR